MEHLLGTDDALTRLKNSKRQGGNRDLSNMTYTPRTKSFPTLVLNLV